MEDAQPLIAFTTCPDTATAERLAEQVVEQRLAACATIIPDAISIYRWQEAVEKESEVLLLIKTTAPRWDALQKTLETSHPYDVPELIAIPLTHVAAPYLGWLRQALEENPVCDG